MKKLLLAFVLIFTASTASVGSVYADPYVAGSTESSPTGVAGKGTAIPVSTPAATPTATSKSAPAATSTATAPATSSGGSGGVYSVKLQEPLNPGETHLVASNGVDLINQYIAMIYKWMASIIGLIAVLMLVVSGIQIIFGGASPEMVSDAKTRVVQSLLSLVLLFATALILKTVNPGFFAV